MTVFAVHNEEVEENVKKEGSGCVAGHWIVGLLGACAFYLLY
jgi:hypothetical protein